MELLPSTNVPMSDPISTPILSVANPTASAIPTPSSAPNSSLASPPSSLDSAAISANIASAFPRGVLAVVALGALGISLEESAIQQILQELPPSRIIDVPPGIPSFQATSVGEGIVAPIAEQALAPAHKPVLGAHPVVSSPPTGSNNESMVAAVVEQARASEELPILGAHPVVSSPPTGSNNKSMVTAVVEQARASEELSYPQ
ncbi:hypothetical protein BKA70DRAFT_1437234 [Coprinopsis sp. MPI-PUGE-AT-0042]|nr:hypothetical protein BKA70DRAFT_1437234 [Coprinopsis sp. MPI-PUGE-AT-0042]